MNDLNRKEDGEGSKKKNGKDITTETITSFGVTIVPSRESIKNRAVYELIFPKGALFPLFHYDYIKLILPARILITRVY